jgi:hypothetical protein
MDKNTSLAQYALVVDFVIKTTHILLGNIKKKTL